MLSHALFQPALKIVSISVQPEQLRAQISGRRRGLLASLLHVFNLGGVYSFAVSPEGFYHQTTSFFGTEQLFCARGHASNSVTAFKKRTEFLALAFLCIVLASQLAMWKIHAVVPVLCVALAFVCIACFFLLRGTFQIGVISDAVIAQSLRLMANDSELEQLRTIGAMIDALIRHGSPGDQAAPQFPGESAPSESIKPPPAFSQPPADT
jgi:hypothetical protein